MNIDLHDCNNKHLIEIRLKYCDLKLTYFDDDDDWYVDDNDFIAINTWEIYDLIESS